MNWIAKISGNTRDLEFLTEVLSKDPEIYKMDEDYFLESERLSSSQNIGEARRTANRQLDIIKSVLLFETDSARDLSIDGVGVLRDGDFHAQSANAGILTVLPPLPDKEQIMSDFKPVDEYLKLADDDPTVQDLVDLSLRGISWVNLYRIFEFIQDNPNDSESIVSKGWITGSDKDRLTHTANSREAVGDDARHAKENRSSPDNPMSLNEASHIVGVLVRNWLNERWEQQYPDNHPD